MKLILPILHESISHIGNTVLWQIHRAKEAPIPHKACSCTPYTTEVDS